MSDNHPRPNEENVTFEKPNARAETATDEIDRVEAMLPDRGVASECQDEDRRKGISDVDKVST